MKYESELMKIISTYNKVLVYGAQLKGVVLISRIKGNLPHTEIFVAVTDTHGELTKCSGYIIRNIGSYVDMASECLVLIASSDIFRAEMQEYASKLGFVNVISISDEVHSDMYPRFERANIAQTLKEIRLRQKKSLFVQYQALNLNRLNNLRLKAKNGGKVRVLFLLTKITKFNFASIYRAMSNNGLFEPAIWCFEEWEEYYEDKGFVVDLTAMRNYYGKLKIDGFNVIWGYDEYNNPKDIQEYSPDIVFFNAPYSFNSAGHQLPSRIVSNYLTCYLPYGMHVSNELGFHFENDYITACWLHFIDTRQAFDYCAKKAFTNGINTVLSGHPMLDGYAEPRKPFVGLKLPSKPVVVYAPHWSIETWHNTATFHIHAAKIMELLIANPTVNFIYKPHHLLSLEIHIRENRPDRTSVTYAEYQEYCDNWRNSPNGVIVEDSSFIDLFKNADCLITDSYTFLTAWLPTEKPCIFLMNPDGPKDPYKYYYDFIKPVIDSYYTVYTNDELCGAFNSVFIAGNDEKAAERKAMKEKLIYNLGHAGEFIANYIERLITGGL